MLEHMLKDHGPYLWRQAVKLFVVPNACPANVDVTLERVTRRREPYERLFLHEVWPGNRPVPTKRTEAPAPAPAIEQCAV